MRMDHIGVAVGDLEEALRFWRDQMGARVSEIEVVESQKARVAFLDTGETITELIEPTDPDSAIGRFLASGKKGLHHVCYEVDDIDTQLEKLSGQGVQLVTPEAVPGSRGTRVAFIHPRAAGGVLIELVEYPKT